ncbi:unnamed protein product [marine sediment metagenome]|uniref:Uncharacterized protein n=1 Tax=marine sediment metagenome TaxID=412755 RepID=X1FNC0_9ZZZZ
MEYTISNIFLRGSDNFNGRNISKGLTGYFKSLSQKDLIKITKFSKGLISRYINNLVNLNLIQIAEKKRGKERFYELTEKGKWYI